VNSGTSPATSPSTYDFPESRFINKITIDFDGLPTYIIRDGIVRKFEKGRFNKDTDYMEWKQNYLAFLETVPDSLVLKAVDKGIEYAQKVYEYHLNKECTNPEDCPTNKSLMRRIAITEKIRMAFARAHDIDQDDSAGDQQIPILRLKESERIWMMEVFRRQSEGEKFTFRDIWSVLHEKLPVDFRPKLIDERLIEANGERLRLLGVLALQGNYGMLDLINRSVMACKALILKNPSIEDIAISELSKIMQQREQDISIAFHLMREYGHFYTGSTFVSDSTQLKSISVKGSDYVYDQYIHFEGIEQLIKQRHSQPRENGLDSFTAAEAQAINEKIDAILNKLYDLELGQQIIWESFEEEMEELKKMYDLSKKNWKRLFAAKVVDMVASGVISETVSKKIVELISPLVGQLMSGLKLLSR
jgi:hypothetical protein